ncbi:tape measure protein [Dyadobacter sp. CY261]|uniref:tape measure protein n=1 Tax=Dyadobacter sp. CY261 TaxID=2907203 RepID=UPI001F164EF8|nr:tape measure protein [Dyadobacter sp. CY261]MCF0074483.1 tape measure protein [Dyadobacter sp. CY261]
MAGELGAANIRIGATIKDLLDGMRQVSASVKTTVYDVNARLSDSYKRAAKEQALFRGGLGKLSDDLSSLGGKLSQFVTLPTLFAGGKAFKDFADLQKLEIGLKQYGESLKTVKELAKLPNVNVEGAAQSLVQLRAIGVESKLAQRGITAFANAITAAGKSSTDLQPALANIAQMLSTNVVSAADVKELANRIPQARKALIAAFGTASGEELTKLGVENVVRGLIEQLEKLPKVGSGAATAMEQFQDSMKFVSATMGESINRAFNLTENIKGLGDWVEKLTEGFKSLSPNIQDQIIKFGALAAVIGPTLIGVAQLIKLAPLLASGFSLIGGPITIAVTALASFIIYYKDIIKLLEGAAIKFVGINNALKSNPLTMPFSASKGGVADVTANGILAQNAKWRQQERASERRALREENERNREIANAQSSAQKSVAASATVAAEAYEKMSDAAFQIWQIDLASKWKNEQESLKAAIQGYKELMGVVASLKVSPLASKGMNFGGPALGSFAGAAATMDDTIGKIKNTETEFTKSSRKIKADMDWLNSELTDSWAALKANIGIAFSEGIGDLMSGMDGSMKSLGQNILGIFADILSNLGKAMITWAATVTTAKLALKSLNPYIAAAAGAAALIASKVLKNQMTKTPKFATGAAVYGPMTAIVGDNPNARHDPELIAPASKVDKYIEKSIKTHGGGGGASVFIPDIVLRGEDMYISFKRVEKRNKAIFG